MNNAPQSKGFGRYRIALTVLAAGLITIAGHGAQYLRGQLIPEVQLKNGTVLHDVTVVAIGATTVVARWNGGMGTIVMSQLPDAMHADFAAVAPKPAVTPAGAGDPAPVAMDAKQLATAELPTEIKLTNGFVMHKAHVTRWDTNAVLISYQGGIVSVRFQNILREQRVIFQARKDEALAQQAKYDANALSGQVTAAGNEQAQRDKEAADREANEKKEEEIRNGISFHYLVKGMTKDDVKRAYGKPPDDHGDSFLYVSRGHDKYGNSADRTLMFRDGTLVGWHDARDGDPDGAVDH